MTRNLLETLQSQWEHIDAYDLVMLMSNHQHFNIATESTLAKFSSYLRAPLRHTASCRFLKTMDPLNQSIIKKYERWWKCFSICVAVSLNFLLLLFRRSVIPMEDHVSSACLKPQTISFVPEPTDDSLLIYQSKLRTCDAAIQLHIWWKFDDYCHG